MTQNKNKSSNDYVRYSSIAMEMVILIVASVLGGKWIDKQLALETPVFTLILSFGASIGAIFLLIKKLS